MYAKTNPRAVRISPRQKRIFAVAAVVVVVLFGGLAAWGATAHDTYGTSAHGCVSVTVPNSTGGAVLHYCGSQAQAFCQASFRSRDQVSLRARPQCVLAGAARVVRYRSTMIVTGPSLTRDTFMSAPNTPVSTRAPRSRRACTTAPTRGSATGPGAAADQDGRRPLARSA